MKLEKVLEKVGRTSLAIAGLFVLPLAVSADSQNWTVIGTFGAIVVGGLVVAWICDNLI